MQVELGTYLPIQDKHLSKQDLFTYLGQIPTSVGRQVEKQVGKLGKQVFKCKYMNIYIYFGLSHVIDSSHMPIFLNMKMQDKTPCLYTFQDENESQNIWNKNLVASHLRLNIFSCKLLAIKKLYPICFGFHSHLEKYIINQKSDN